MASVFFIVDVNAEYHRGNIVVLSRCRQNHTLSRRRLEMLRQAPDAPVKTPRAFKDQIHFPFGPTADATGSGSA